MNFFDKYEFRYDYAVTFGIVSAPIEAYAIFGPIEAWHGGVNHTAATILWVILFAACVLSLVSMFRKIEA